MTHEIGLYFENNAYQEPHKVVLHFNWFVQEYLNKMQMNGNSTSELLTVIKNLAGWVEWKCRVTDQKS